MKEQFYFVLYGEDAVNTLDNGGIESFKEGYENGDFDFSVKKYDKSKDNVVAVLEDADGWNDYCFIEEEMYNTLTNL